MERWVIAIFIAAVTAAIVVPAAAAI